MATPRAAEHRDLEQRFRNIEAKLREVTTKSLTRRKATVTGGDVVVSDGGGIRIKDGGTLQADYPDDQGGGPATVFGPSGLSYTLSLLDPAGSTVFAAGANESGSSVDVAAGSVDLDAGGMATMSYAGPLSLTATLRVGDAGIGNRGIALTTNETVNITATGGTFISHTTTSDAANCRIDTTGRIFRVTSSRRHKENIRELVTDPTVALRLMPRAFTRKDERDNPTEYVGFIAEEAAELGLDEFVERGADGQVESFSYPMWTVALQGIVRHQQEQLDTQARTIADLTTRLQRLERQRL